MGNDECVNLCTVLSMKTFVLCSISGLVIFSAIAFFFLSTVTPTKLSYDEAVGRYIYAKEAAANARKYSTDPDEIRRTDEKAGEASRAMQEAAKK